MNENTATEMTKADLIARIEKREHGLTTRALTRMKKADLENLLRDLVAAEKAPKRGGKIYGDPYATRNGRKHVHVLGADGTEIAYLTGDGEEILRALLETGEAPEGVEFKVGRVRTLVEGSPNDWYKHGRIDEIAYALGNLAVAVAV